MDVGRDYRTVRQVYQTHGKTAREDSCVLSVEMRCARRPAFEIIFYFVFGPTKRNYDRVSIPIK